MRRIAARALPGEEEDRDAGAIALAFAMAIVALLTILTAIVIQVAMSNQQNTAFRSEQTQALDAADAGLSLTIAEINQNTYESFPCSVSNPSISTVPVTSGFSVSVYYFSVYPPPNPVTGVLSCSPSLSTDPASAILVSTGYAGRSPQAQQVLEDELQLGTTESGSVYDQALFSDSNLSFSQSATLDGSNGYNANAYVNGNFICSQSSTFQGNFLVQGAYTTGQSCKVLGNLWTDGNVSMTQSSQVGGWVKAAGTSPSPSTVTMAQSSQVVGDAYAAGTIKNNGSGSIGGKTGTCPTNTCFQSQGASLSAPTAETFPQETFTATDYPSSSWNLIIETDCGNSSNDTGGVYSDLSAMSTATKPTVIDTDCSINLNKSTVWQLAQNLVLFTSGGFSMTQSAQITSTSSTVRDLYLFVPYGTSCSGGAGGISMSQSSQFTSSVDVLLYTPCTVTLGASSSVYGQIYGGTIDETQSVTDHFEQLPGVPGGAGGGQTSSASISLVFERQLDSAPAL